jgi:lysozyme|tara:strand:+ start:193 stop:678 length:486 start_codon:yes stop_codon:yes gene_type:complete
MKYNRDELVKMIAIHEGIVLNVYQDHLGIDTVGIGRNLQDRGITDGELSFINKTMDEVYENGLTEEEAYYLCMNDIAIVEKELLANKPIVNQLNDVRQMVLIDMAFNMGVPRLMKFKNMWLAIEKVNYQLANEEMIDSRWAGQVGSRAMKLSLAMKNGEWV